MLNSMRAPELPIKINLNKSDTNDTSSAFLISNQTESLASIRELEGVPEKVISNKEESNFSSLLKTTNFKNELDRDNYPLNTSNENEKNANVCFGHFFCY